MPPLYSKQRRGVLQQEVLKPHPNWTHPSQIPPLERSTCTPAEMLKCVDFACTTSQNIQLFSRFCNAFFFFFWNVAEMWHVVIKVCNRRNLKMRVLEDSFIWLAVEKNAWVGCPTCIWKIKPITWSPSHLPFPFEQKPFFLKTLLVLTFRIEINVIYSWLYDHSHPLNFEADLKYPTSCLGGGGAQFTNKFKTFFKKRMIYSKAWLTGI